MRTIPSRLLPTLRAFVPLCLLAFPLTLCAFVPLCLGASSPPPLTTLSFNIRYGTANDGENHWDHRREMVIETIKDHNPDILGLQEALNFQINEIQSAIHGYTLIGVGRDNGATRGEYSPILIRTARFAIDQSGTFWLSDTPTKPGTKSWGNGIPRICTWTRLIDNQSDQGLYIYNVHLDHQSQPSRERAVELIAQHIANRGYQDPIIIMGDFNAGEDNAATQYLTGQSNRASSAEAFQDHTPPESPNLTDTFRAKHPDATNVGTFSAFKGKTDGPKIDYILIDNGFTVVGAGIDRRETDGRNPSDHFPVWAKLQRN